MNSIFVNMAMLETIRSRNSGYFVDHFVNFLAVGISVSNSEELNIDDTQKLFQREFGFNIPLASVELILSRATKKKYLRQVDSKYLPVMDKIHQIANIYLKNKQQLIDSQKSLFVKFIDFTRSKHGVDLSEDEAERLFITFFKKYQLEMLDEKVEQIDDPAISSDGIKNQNFLLSQFITTIAREKDPVFEHVKIVIRGYFVANFINIRGTETDTNNLKGLTAVLDTPILMGLSGFNGKLRKDYCREMVSLGTSLGVKFIVFEHIFEEWESIFHAWVGDLRSKNYRAFNSSTLALLQTKGIDSSAIESMIPRLRSTLDSMDVKIVDLPPIIAEHSIDESSLLSHLQSIGAPDTNNRLDRDVKTTVGVMSLRKGRYRMALHEKPTVFITPNLKLITEINAFLTREVSSKSVPIVSNENWLINLAWMVSPDTFPDLPNQLLVASCYGAMGADDKFWDNFLIRLKRLRSENRVQSDDYKLVRYEVDLKNCIKELSVTQGVNFTDEAVIWAVNQTKEKILKEKDTQIDKFRARQQLVLENLNKKCNFAAGVISWIVVLLMTLLFVFVGYKSWSNQADLVWFLISMSFAVICLYFDISLFNRRKIIQIKICKYLLDLFCKFLKIDNSNSIVI